MTATVLDGDGGEDVKSFQVTVNNVAPTLSVSDQSAFTGKLLTLPNLAAFTDPGFDNTAVNPAISQTFTYQIAWGDGSDVVTGTAPIDVLGQPGTPTQGHISGQHTYADSGTYTVTATLTDDDGGQDVKTFSVTVYDEEPYLSISGNSTAAEGSPYTLNLSATGDAATAITGWMINWGDGNIQSVDGNPPSVNHYYADGPADYKISATATDGNRAFDNAGFLDLSFGTDGQTSIAQGAITAVQSDGKIIVAGDSVLTRYNTDGSVDTTFGPNADGTITVSGNGNISGMVIQPSDDKILLTIGNSTSTTVERYLANGEGLDTSFNSTGQITINSFGAARTFLQDRGDILLEEDGCYGGDYKINIVRVPSNGSRDYSFGEEGVLTADFGTGGEYGDVACQSDGKILMAVSENEVGYELVRYDADGQLDTSFGTDNTGTVTYDGYFNLYFMAVQPDDKIVLGGDDILSQYDADGKSGRTFGSDYYSAFIYCGSNAVQADGKIILAGNYSIDDTRPALLRLNQDGSIDTTFGENGFAINNDYIDQNASYDFVSIRPDGEIVALGSDPCTNEYFLGCYSPGAVNHNVHVANVAPTLSVVDSQIAYTGQSLNTSPIISFTDPGFDNPLADPATSETFTYQIDWGDGTDADTGSATIQTPGSPGVLTQGVVDADHTFDHCGRYTVTVTLTDDDGGQDTKTFNLTVANTVSDASDLQAISDDLNGIYILTQNIDASGISSFIPIGNNETPFTGTLLGNNHVIAGLTIDQPSEDYVGLFGCIGPSGSISNLGLEDVNVNGGDYTGGLAGYNEGTITDAYVTGNVSGNDYTGGLVGANHGSSASIKDSFARATIVGASYVGGFAGDNENGASICDCYSMGGISASDNAGGFLGLDAGSAASSIDNCYSSASVTATGAVAGGFAGYKSGAGVISDSFATGNVTGLDDDNDRIGSFLGGADDLDSITNCYYNQYAVIQNSGSGSAVNSAGATATAKSALADVGHAVFTSSTSVPWTFSTPGHSDAADWAMVGGIPHLQMEWNLPWVYGDETLGQQPAETHSSMAMAASSNATQASWNPNPSGIVDLNLANAVRQACGLSSTVTITIGDVASLTSLTADSNLITSLAGLADATALTSLTLIPSDFSATPGSGLQGTNPLYPLENLPSLTSLTLQRCGLNDNSFAFTGFSVLQTLDLRYNDLTRVPQTVANLSSYPYHLTQLYLYGNGISQGLVGHWTFDESSGPLAADSAYPAHDGTLHNGATWTAGGKIGGAVSLNGSNGYVSIPSSSDLEYHNYGDEFTISLWVYIDPRETSGGGLVTKYWNGSYGLWNYNLYLDSNGKLVFYLLPWNDAVTTISTTNALSTSCWHYVVATAGSHQLSLYVDGLSVATPVQQQHTTKAWSTAWQQDQDMDLNIGTIYPTSKASDQFWGEIDDVRIYNCALTDEEVVGLYNSTNSDAKVNISSLNGKVVNVNVAPDHPENAQTIAELAAALNYNPIQMYEWVLNNIKYQPYPGSMKGSLAVLETRAGNDWDTDTLLKDLYAQAGITLNYANVTVIENINTVLDWLGVTNAKGAYDVLYNAGLQPGLYKLVGSTYQSLDPSTQWSQTEYIAFDHTYLHRAAGGGLPEMYLDPTWKFRDFQPGISGIAANVTFNESAYLSMDPNASLANKEMPYEYYEDAVGAYLATNNSGSTIADVAYDGPIHPQQMSSLPQSINDLYDGYSGTIVEHSSLSDPGFDNYLNKLRVSVDLPQTGTLTVTPRKDGTITLQASSAIFTPAMNGAPVVLDTTPVGNTMAFSIITNITSNTSTVLVSGTITPTTSFATTFSLPGLTYLDTTADLALKEVMVGNTDASACPTLYIDNLDGTRSYTLQSAIAVPSANQTFYVVLERTQGDGPTDSPPPDTVPHVYQRNAKQYVAVGLDVDQFSQQSLVQLRSSLNNAEISMANGGSPGADQLIGGLLELGLGTYFEEFQQAKDALAGLCGSIDVHWSSGLGLATSSVDNIANVQNASAQNVQFPYLPDNVGFDIPQNIAEEIAIDGDTSLLPQLNHLVGDTMSSLESSVWEELTNMPAVSTIKLFQMAHQNSSINFATFNSTNAHSPTDIYNFFDATSITSDRRTAYANGIYSFILKGYTVDVFSKEITIGNNSDPNKQWHGIGYICRLNEGAYNFTDSFIIHGGLGSTLDAPHGGFGVWPAVPVDPTSILPTNLLTPDPINTADGNVVHDETDISIPNLGVSLDFSRHYDSFNTEPSGATVWSDRGMGDGWSFSFSDRLCNGDSYSNGAGTLTSTTDKTWFTSDGIQYTFIYSSQTWITPAGLFGSLTSSGATYIWTDTDGTQTSFDTSGRLISIKDRFGNGVGVDYTSSSSAQIKDVYDVMDPTRTRCLTFTYNTNNRITTITDFTGRTWPYGYNANNQLNQVTAPSDTNTPQAIVRYAYYNDANNPNNPVLARLLKSVTDPNGNVTSFAYYVNRRGFQVVDPQGNVQSLSYNLYRNRTAFTDELGNTTYTTYDAKGNPLSVVSPDGTKVSYTWDPVTGLKLTDTDAYGATESYLYDPITTPGYTNQIDRTYSIASGTIVVTWSLPSVVGAWTGTAKLYYCSNTYAWGKFFTEFAEVPVGNCSYTWSVGGSGTKDIMVIINAVAAPINNSSGDLLRFTNRLDEITSYTYTDYGNLYNVIQQPDGAATYYYYYTSTGVPNTYPDQHGKDYCLWKVVKVVDAQGDTTTTTYTYPAQNRGLPLTITTPNQAAAGSGYETIYTYNEAGQVRSVQSHPDSTTWFTETYVYDTSSTQGRGYLTSSTDGNGNTTTYTYDLLGHRLTQTLPDPDGNASSGNSAPKTTYSYDPAGDLLSTSLSTVSSVTPLVTGFEYDSMQRVVKIENADGTYSTKQYDAAGNLVYETDELGRITQYVYDSRNRCIATIYPDGSVVETDYDGGGRVASTTDADGNTTAYTYDKLGRTLTVTLPDPDGPGGPLTASTTTYSYDDATDAQYTTDALGNQTIDIFDKLGHKTEMIAPDPSTGQASTSDSNCPKTYYSYDADGNLDYVTDARGGYSGDPAHTTYYVYDESDRKIMDILPDPSGGSSYLYTWYYYDNDNNLIDVVNSAGATSATRPASVTDSNNKVMSAYVSYTTEYIYDHLNRKIAEIQPDPDGSGAQTSPSTAYGYDQYGNLTTVTDPRGNSTWYAYDNLGRQTQVTDAMGAQAGDPAHTTTTWYDAVGNAVAVVSNVDPNADPIGRITFYQYDARNRKIRETQPVPAAVTQTTPQTAPQTTWQYDPAGNLTSVTDPLGCTTWTIYDHWNRPTKVTDAQGLYAGDPEHTTTTTYDLLGHVISVTDQLGRTTQYVYDHLGRKTEEVDPSFTYVGTDGQDHTGTSITYYGYDSNGNLKYVTDPLGSGPADPAHTTWYYYDALNRQTCVIDALADKTIAPQSYNDLPPATQPAHSVLTVYDALGDIKSVTDEMYRKTDYTYDNLGRKISEIAPAPSAGAARPTTLYAYDADGNLIQTTDPLNQVTTYNYDNLNRQVSEFLTPVSTARSVMDILTIGDYGGAIGGKVVCDTITNGSHTSTTFTSLNGGILTLSAGGTLTIQPIPGGPGGPTVPSVPTPGIANAVPLGSCVIAWGGPSDPNHDTSCTLFMNVDSKKYDVYISWISDPSNSTAAPYRVYDGASLEASGYINEATPSANNNFFQDDSGLYWMKVLSGVSFASGKITVKLDADLANTANRVVFSSIKAAQSPATVNATTYDAAGNVKTVQDADGNFTTYAYDRLNRLIKETDALGHFSTYKYDADGNQIQKTDADGQVTEYTYDPLGRETVEQWMDTATPTVADHTIRTYYNAVGQAQFVTESDALSPASGATYEYDYDPAGHLVTEQMAPLDKSQVDTATTSYHLTLGCTLDTNGDGIPEEVCGVQRIGGFPLGRGIFLHATAAGYDPVIYLVPDAGITMVSGTITNIDLTKSVAHSMSLGNGDSYLFYTFDIPAGWYAVVVAPFWNADKPGTLNLGAQCELIQVNSKVAVNTQLAFDPTVVTDPLTTLNYSYYADGSVQKVQYTEWDAASHQSITGSTTYTYDALGRVTEVHQSGTGIAIAEKKADYTYYDDGQVKTTRLYSASVCASVNTYVYDGMGRLTSLTDTNASGSTVIDSFTYTYDADSNVKTMTTLGDGEDTYTLDCQDQLTGVTGVNNQTFAYDADGNRVTTSTSGVGSTSKIGADNELQSDGTYNYTYDKDGNLITRTKISDRSVTVYEWDYRDRLTAVTYYASASDYGLGKSSSRVQYTYDYLNRQIRRVCDDDGSKGSDQPTYDYDVYDGDHALFDYTDPDGLAGSAAGNVSHWYLYGPAVDEILADEKITTPGHYGDTRWLLADKDGTVRDAIDSTDHLKEHIKYDPYGNITSQTDSSGNQLSASAISALDLIFGYDGRPLDPMTGLYNNRARWYDPKTGRFMSEDPADADPNLYRYCGNNPVNETDPTGMCPGYSGDVNIGFTGVLNNPLPPLGVDDDVFQTTFPSSSLIPYNSLPVFNSPIASVAGNPSVLNISTPTVSPSIFQEVMSSPMMPSSLGGLGTVSCNTPIAGFSGESPAPEISSTGISAASVQPSIADLLNQPPTPLTVKSVQQIPTMFTEFDASVARGEQPWYARLAVGIAQNTLAAASEPDVLVTYSDGSQVRMLGGGPSTAGLLQQYSSMMAIGQFARLY